VTRLGPFRIALEAALLAAAIIGLAAWRYPVAPRVLLGLTYALAATGTAARLDRTLGIAWQAVMFADIAALAGVPWWHGEPLNLRVSLAAFYGLCAVTALAAALKGRPT
jgi:hypothetical protein